MHDDLRGKVARFRMLTDFSREQLEDFLTIPVFEPGPETDELRRKLAALLGPISPPPPLMWAMAGGAMTSAATCTG